MYDINIARRKQGFVIALIACIVVCSSGCRRSGSPSDMPNCIKNMVLIEVAKDKLAASAKKDIGSSVDEAEVKAFIKDGKIPTCPNGGRYTYNPIGKDPECSIHGSRTAAIMSFEK